MNTRLQNGFGQIGNDVIRDQNLVPAAKALYAYLCTYTDSETNLTFVGINRMCAELNVTRSTIKRNLSILKQAGVITRYKSDNKWFTKILK